MRSHPAAARPGTVRTEPEPPVYTLGSDPEEQARLERQAEELREYTEALLDRVPAAAGAQAVDLGCGPRGALEVLSQRVGPAGRVVGLDVEPAHVELARQLVRERKLDNVLVSQGDARRSGLPPDSFDLVHARLVLVTIPEPEAVMEEMVRLTKPGGWIVSLEADAEISILEPPDPAWERLQEIFKATWSADGAEFRMGRLMPGLFRRAGLVQIGVEVRGDVVPAGHTRRTVRPDLVRAMRPKILARGIATETELEDVDRHVRRRLAEPDTFCLSYLNYLTWGRKAPGAG